MILLSQFIRYIKTNNLFQKGDRLLIAVSGGVDSVVLCDLCSKAGYDFAIAHCNFCLRGEESDADERFVKELAEKYRVEIFSKKFDTEAYAGGNKLSIQVAARALRYQWFDQLINSSPDPPLKYLLTAHHANDNIETVLMNFFKGTGIGGLQGIMPGSGSNHHIIRPLLFAKKTMLVSYAQENNISYREDASNMDDKYTRNYFRNKLIPLVKEIYPRVEDNLLDNILRFNEINIIYRQSIDAIIKKLVTEKNGEKYLPVLKLLKTKALRTILFEITKEYNFSPAQITDVINLLHTMSGKYVESATHRILRNRDWLVISGIGAKTQSHFLVEENDRIVIFNDSALTIEKISRPAKIDPDPSVAQLDDKEIKFPLLLRRWKRGDYFYPLGMKKKKKLSRFFIDQKLSVTEKESAWVLEMNKKIIWVIGQRIDDRFRLNESTKNILKIRLTSAENAGLF